ncbi:hypothetical protein GN956_G8384 [Arapaima gigas]
MKPGQICPPHSGGLASASLITGRPPVANPVEDSGGSSSARGVPPTHPVRPLQKTTSGELREVEDFQDGAVLGRTCHWRCPVVNSTAVYPQRPTVEHDRKQARHTARNCGYLELSGLDTAMGHSGSRSNCPCGAE